ncbi:MAG: nucleotidyltransferase domain-containing protein [Planctomycetia bacterium]|jgi:predicted nucleotidyltransferase
MTTAAEPSSPRTPFEDRYLAEAKRICLAAVPDPRFEIFLFGSRARGHCEHSSDIDIGIAGPEPLPGGISRLVNLLVESDVPWRPQVVDFALVTDVAFRRHAYEGREIWRAAN